MSSQEYYLAIDAGSKTVLAVIAQPSEEKKGMYKILGLGIAQSRGIRHGIVYDVEEAVGAIRDAVQFAQGTVGNHIQVRNAWVAIGGVDLRSKNCKGVSVIRRQEVRAEEKREARQYALNSANRQANGRDIIKCTLQGYNVDRVRGTHNPLGLVGESIEADYHVVYGARSGAENLRRTLQRVGLDLAGYVPHPWASARAVLSESDMKCGAAVLDLGAETTSISVFTEGVIRLTQVKPWGADYMTRDVAAVLGITLAQAEEMKIKNGHCQPENVVPNESVWSRPLDGMPSRRFSRLLLTQTLKARAEEMMRHYRKLLEDAGLYKDIRVVVLTGGGANLSGIELVARQILGKPIRKGFPCNIDGLPPIVNHPKACVVCGLIAEAGSGENGNIEQSRVRSASPLQLLKSIFIGNY